MINNIIFDTHRERTTKRDKTESKIKRLMRRDRQRDRGGGKKGRENRERVRKGIGRDEETDRQ